MADADHHDQGQTCDVATRRTVLRGALIAGVATPLLAACSSGGGGNSSTAAAGTGGGGGGAGKGSAGAGGSGSGNGGGSAPPLTTTSDIPTGSGKIFGTEGVVVTQPKAGEFKGFTNICTHMGCPVHDVTTTINCICHGSEYSITDGSVVRGPATVALAAKPLKVSGKDINLA
jgi:nitrite reductase/ring-hydroxylating ferredoxin subunit